jgi:hypothetical protein
MRKLFVVILACFVLGALPVAAGDLQFSTDLGFAAMYPPLGLFQVNITESATTSFADDLIFPMTLRPYASLNLTPITLDAKLGVSFTPIALLVLDVYTGLGTGWDLLGNHGLAREDTAVNGVVWNIAAAGTLQFDFGIIFPGDWTHIVVQSSHELNYKCFPGVPDGEVWVYQADANTNAWHYKGTATLGYQFPAVPILNMIALQLEFGGKIGTNMNKLILTNAYFLDIADGFSLTLALIYDATPGAGSIQGAVLGSVKLF